MKMSEVTDVMQICENHEDKKEMFLLVKLLRESGFPYFFTMEDEFRPTPFDQDNDERDVESIDWSTFRFAVEIGYPVGCYGLCQMSVIFNTEGDPTLLELLDMTGAEDNPKAKAEDGVLTRNLTADGAMTLIRRFFDENR